jgi:hypothetical protein
MRDQQHLEVAGTPAKANLWKTGLLLAGSALFGGIAVAFWHSRTLAAMREASDRPAPKRPQPTHSSDDDVIF